MKHHSSLVLSLGLAASLAIPVRAELLKNLKTDGSIEVKSYGIDNETDRNGAADDYRSETHTRLGVGGSFDLLDDVHGRVAIIKNNRVYGGGSENLNTVQSALTVVNAYTTIDKVFGHVDFSMGRQFYGDKDDLVIYYGYQPDDILSVTAVDIFRADTSVSDLVKITGIAGKTADTGAVGANSDTDLWGVDANTDKVVPKANLSAFYYTLKTHKALNGTVGNNTLINYGARLKGEIIPGLMYKAEGVANGGRNDDTTLTFPRAGYSGSAYLLGLNYGMNAGEYPVRIHGEYGRGSRDYMSIAAGKRFGKIWGEHTSSALAPSRQNSVGGAGLTNLKVVDAGIGVSCPKTKLSVDLNWYRFQYDANIGGIGTSAGTEYDLILSYPHSENVSFEVSAATFQVGDALDRTAPTPTNPVTRLGADVKIKF